MPLSHPLTSVELTQPDSSRRRTCVWLNSSNAGCSNAIFKIQKVVKNHNHITCLFSFFGLLMSFPDDCGYSLKPDNGTFSSLFLEYLFIYLAVSGLSCGMQDLLFWCTSLQFFHSMWDPQPGIQPHVPHIAKQILNHWTTSEVPTTT